VNPAYFIGITCMAVGAGFIYAAGEIDGRKAKESEVWRDADNTDLGSVDDASRFRNRNRTPGHSAQSDL
jgi:hypothetical protein